MIRVLIADDEIRVCNLIHDLVEWETMDMNVVGIAHNGLQALEMVDGLKPDLIITDIRMPGCTGLELIEQTKKVCPESTFIIISGFAEFEYAKVALKFGISDYLLKPIDRAELLSTVRRVKNEIETSRKEQIFSDRMRRAFHSDQYKVRSCLLMDLVSRRGLAMTMEEINREYRFQFKPGIFQAFVVKLDYQHEAFDPSVMSSATKSIREIALEHLRDLCEEVELWFDDSWGMGVCNYQKRNQDLVRQRFDDCLRAFQVKKNLFPQLIFTITVTPVEEDVDKLAEQVQLARRLAEERLVIGSRRVIDRLPELSGLSILDCVSDFLRQMRTALEWLDLSAVKNSVARLQAQVMETPGVTGREVLKVVVMSGEKILEESDPLEVSDEETEPFRNRCDVCNTADQLIQTLEDMVTRQIKIRADQQMNDETKPVRQAKIFLEQHYMENITLEQVACLIGFNSSYFSVMFKKECGVGFQDYLTALRIDKAKEMLLQTDDSISEICYRVGYNDVKYFSKTFKKATNLRPSEFKKMYGR